MSAILCFVGGVVVGMFWPQIKILLENLKRGKVE